MKLSMCATLLALAAVAALIAAAPAAADTVSSSDSDMPIGKYISYYDKITPAPQTPTKASTKPKSKNGRKLLTQQATQAVQSSTAVQAAQAAASTEGVNSAEKTDKANKDQHYGDSYGGAVSQPPPGAPVYYPPTYSQHGDHYDYIPGHYHYGRKLMAQGQQLLSQGRLLLATQDTDPTQASNKQAAVQKLLAKGNTLINHGRMLMAAEATESTQTANRQNAVQKVETAQGAESAKAVEKSDHWGGSGHYDYFGASYAPHGDHYDYVPPHYHYHEGNHWARKLMASQNTKSTSTANKQDAVANTRTAESAQHGGWGGSGHYDYYGVSYAPHGDHYDYVPPHYHYHEGNHWHRRMMAAQNTESAQATTRLNAAHSTASATMAASAANTKAVKSTQHDGWEGNGHYDYYGPSYAPHGNHYDDVPAHYHYHEGEHEDNGWDHDDDWHKRL